MLYFGYVTVYCIHKTSLVIWICTFITLLHYQYRNTPSGRQLHAFAIRITVSLRATVICAHHAEDCMHSITIIAAMQKYFAPTVITIVLFENEIEIATCSMLSQYVTENSFRTSLTVVAFIADQ